MEHFLWWLPRPLQRLIVEYTGPVCLLEWKLDGAAPIEVVADACGGLHVIGLIHDQNGGSMVRTYTEQGQLMQSWEHLGPQLLVRPTCTTLDTLRNELLIVDDDHATRTVHPSGGFCVRNRLVRLGVRVAEVETSAIPDMVVRDIAIDGHLRRLYVLHQRIVRCYSEHLSGAPVSDWVWPWPFHDRVDAVAVTRESLVCVSGTQHSSDQESMVVVLDATGTILYRWSTGVAPYVRQSHNTMWHTRVRLVADRRPGRLWVACEAHIVLFRLDGTRVTEVDYGPGTLSCLQRMTVTPSGKLVVADMHCGVRVFALDEP